MSTLRIFTQLSCKRRRDAFICQVILIRQQETHTNRVFMRCVFLGCRVPFSFVTLYYSRGQVTVWRFRDRCVALRCVLACVYVFGSGGLCPVDSYRCSCVRVSWHCSVWPRTYTHIHSTRGVCCQLIKVSFEGYEDPCVLLPVSSRKCFLKTMGVVNDIENSAEC